MIKLFDFPARLEPPVNDNAGVIAFVPRMIDVDPPFSLDASLDVIQLAIHLKAGGAMPLGQTQREILVATAARTLVEIDRLDQAARAGAPAHA